MTLVSEIISYDILNGIKLDFVSMDYPCEKGDFFTERPIIELNHCLKGRFEICYDDKYVYHVSQGDFHMGIYAEDVSYSGFAKDYRGACINIDIHQAQQTLDSKYREFGIDLMALKEQLFKQKTNYIVRSNPEVEHIFYELYDVPERIKHAYYKIKVFEILLFLTSFSMEDEMIKDNYFIKDDIRTINEVKNYITSHLDERLTIKSLADHFGISQSKLKTCFKEIYSQSIYTYTKHYKMDKAMEYLRQTEEQINHIAYKLGYSNPSKFSAAFKSVFGVTPKHIRRQELSKRE